MDEMCLMTRASSQRSAPSNGVPMQVVVCLGNMVSADSSFVSPTLTAETEFPTVIACSPSESALLLCHSSRTASFSTLSFSCSRRQAKTWKQ